MNAISSVEISQGTGNVCGKGKTELPWKRSGLVQDIATEVTL